MASRNTKRRAVPLSSPQGAGKRAKKVEICEDTQTNSPSLIRRAKTTAPPKGKPGRPRKVPAAAVRDPTPPPPSPEKVPAGRAKVTGAKRLGIRRGGLPSTSGSGSPTAPAKTNSQVIGEIREILVKSKEEERALLQNVEEIEADDQAEDDNSDSNQPTMNGNKDYTATAYELQEDVDGQGAQIVGGKISTDSDSQDDSTDSDNLDLTRMRMIDLNLSFFDDPTKSHDQWWTEDITREITLCELWEETKWLYDFRERAHQTEDKNATLRRFSTVLQVPPNVIDTRMQSLRNQYQKMHRAAKSGSEPEGETDRQREILNLCFFLRQHIKTSPSLSNYVQATPVKADEDDSSVKSTPARIKSKSTRIDLGHGSEPDLSAILDNTLTPIKGPTPTSSEVDYESDSSQTQVVANQKHFSRNDRIRTASGAATVARRSLRIEESPKHKKTTDSSKIKSLSKNTASKASSCRDTAPLAPKGTGITSHKQQKVTDPKTSTKVTKPKGTPIKKVPATPKKKVPPTPDKKVAATPKNKVSKSVKVATTHSGNTTSTPKQSKSEEEPEKKVPKKMTAAERKKAMKDAPPPDKVTPDAISQEEGDTDDKGLVAPKETEKKQKKVPVKTTAAERKRQMASTSSEQINYDVSLTSTNWYEAQGPAYRRAQEMAKKKEKKDPLMSFMQDKSEQMKIMVGSVQQMASRPSTSNASNPVTGDSPEQLWANSVVPQLLRMEQDVRDQFMVHVMSVAFKAIKGTWPE